jgi:hypothetical protein
MNPSPAVAVVGAGPHALTFLAGLHRAAPDLAADSVVLDPSGRWLERWADLFERLEISHLRSPAVHHPHPEVDAITRRTDLCRDDLVGGSSLRPSQWAFMATCRDLVRELGDAATVSPRAAVACRPLDGDPGQVEVDLDDGTTVQARRVVLATNAARRVGLPGLPPFDRQADLRDARADERVIVIGGGLTAAQLVDQAVARDAAVTLVTRRPLVARSYDVDPGWMGPKCLRGFATIEDPAERIRAAARARGGGTVPPLVLDRLRDLASSRRIRIVEGSAVVGVRRIGDHVMVRLADGCALAADRVVTAIGSVARVEFDALLAPLAAAGGVETALGHPLLTDGLRLPGTGVHVMGRLAAERLGPAAGNLAGARRAAARIVADLVGLEPVAADPGVTTGAEHWPVLRPRRAG